MLRLSLLALVPLSSALFFNLGGGGGGGCGCQPACAPAPAPVCQPAPAPVCPPQPSCGGGYGGGGYSSGGYGGGYAQQSYSSGGSYAQAPAQSYVQAPQQSYQPSYAAPQPSYSAPQQGYAQPSVGGYQQGSSYGVAPQPSVGGGGYSAPSGGYAQPAAPAQGGSSYQEQSNYQPQPAGYASQQGPAPVAVAQQGGYSNGPAPAQGAYHEPAAAAKVVEVVEEETTVEEKQEKEENKEVPEKLETSVVVTESKTDAPSTVVSGSTVAPTPAGTEEEETGEERVVDIATLKLSNDPLCNSDDLRALMVENMDDNLNSSKRLIQLAAEAQFGGRFDVICANGDFSYVTNTELYCQETKGDVSCYTYRQL